MASNVRRMAKKIPCRYCRTEVREGAGHLCATNQPDAEPLAGVCLRCGSADVLPTAAEQNRSAAALDDDDWDDLALFLCRACGLWASAMAEPRVR